MKAAPPFLISAVLAFWGWQSGFWPIAIVMIVVLESQRFVKSKWDLKFEHFNRISDLCALFLVGTAVYVLLTNARQTVQTVTLWAPMILFPLLMAQIVSVAGKINIKSMLMTARRKKKTDTDQFPDIDVTYLYAIIGVISAGTANVRTELFYIAVIIFALWMLFPLRHRRYHLGIWMAVIMVAGVSGYFSHQGLGRLQDVITELTIRHFFSGQSDPFSRVTAIGDIGKLKMSNEIVFRVVKPNPDAILLKEASYNAFSRNRWFAGSSQFTPVEPQSDQMSWKLTSPVTGHQSITLYTKTYKGMSLLKMPTGSQEVLNLKAPLLEKSNLDTVKVQGCPRFIGYTIIYDSQKPMADPPTESDLQMPMPEQEFICQLLTSLDLENQAQDKIVSRVKDYFSQGFTYSLNLKGAGPYSTALENFLFGTHQGHCEFFATATVLLLRAAGIPARYTTGYYASEYSKMEKLMVVRVRDAHAWVQAYVNGKWIDIDTTPSIWPEFETQQMGTSVVSDFFSAVKFKLMMALSKLTKNLLKKIAPWLVIPLIVILWFRLRKGKKIKRVITENDRTDLPGSEQLSIGIHLIEEKLRSFGYERFDWETFGAWNQRIFEDVKDRDDLPVEAKDLEILIDLHYKSRYGRSGLDAREQTLMAQKAQQILDRWNQKEKRVNL